MKIGYDFHGVIEAYPKIFQPKLELLNQEFEIYIISGPPSQQLKQELEDCGYYLGMHYHSALSVVDWLKNHNVPMDQHTNGSWYCADEIWWKSKAMICEEYGIDMLYDDKLEYAEHMTGGTLFLHLQPMGFIPK